MSKRGGLGRGLGALIPDDEGAPHAGLTYLPVERIIPNPHQPRNHIDDESLAELAQSIREHGVLQPLIVASEPRSEFYALIAGERRLRAARLAGLAQVPVVIRSASDQERLELALIENIQRADLSALETAEAYQRLADEFGLRHEDIARQVGKSRVAVTNTLGLIKLPDAVKEALRDGQISEGHAKALNGLRTEQAQLSALKTILEREMSVRQTEALVRLLNGERPSRKAKHLPSPEVQELEERLRGRLGTRVALRHGNKGGSLVIYYFSDEELDNIINQIMGTR